MSRPVPAVLTGPPASVAEYAVVGDYIPADLDPAGPRPSHARLVSRYTVTDRKDGAALAQAAIERFARPPGGEPGRTGGAPAGRGTGPAADVHELIVTHNFLISWFVRHALDAPDWRWMGLNQQNCALTVILYQPGLPPSLAASTTPRTCRTSSGGPGFPPGSARLRLMSLAD